MFDELRHILVEKLRIPAHEITPEATTFEVGLDSLAVIELSAEIRRRTGAQVPPSELGEMEQLGDIAEAMRQRAAAP
ncbi:acyl carrier protein [Streptomyces sp. NPDC019937]|uniref:acyl carrier protein n=1 Tax=Streptomyces sp. NPDC019937 TaxID=3154787 RepID=UPI0033D44F3D